MMDIAMLERKGEPMSDLIDRQAAIDASTTKVTTQELKQELKNSTDAIDRQAAIDAVLDRMNVEKHGRNAKPEEIQWALEKLPAVQTCDDAVSRQAAIERATKDHDFFRGATIPTDKARRDELLNVMCWLRELPAVQPQSEIVRCKDCKWCEDADGSVCKNPASWVVATDCDFGCVLAERRTDEQTDRH